MDGKISADRLSKSQVHHLLIDGVPEISFHGLRKKYKVSIHQFTRFNDYWTGTKIVFSGENASYFYRLLKTGQFDWNLLKFEGHNLNLGRIDLCFSRPNDFSHTNKLQCAHAHTKRLLQIK